ncbi:hypothetical protein MAM1_0177c07323 [Mucor ambiguus]|uniref:Uncharacterized protein n=1 Tax=Mucor ambiguus TaxID=91626 RepID=A0A0C9MK41_9FUNG|nr:hypothetical protein MAM1_0177c07323 [Mucor ambiguus]
MVDYWCCILGILVLFTAVLAAAANVVHLLIDDAISWCGSGACFCYLPTFICCLGAVYCCCCCSLIIAVFVMHSLGKLVLQFTAAVVVYLLSWRLLGVHFCCCCCRSFAVLVILYRVNLVLSAAAASIYWLCWRCSVLALSAACMITWNFCFVLCFVDVPIAEAQHYFIRGWG